MADRPGKCDAETFEGPPVGLSAESDVSTLHAESSSTGELAKEMTMAAKAAKKAPAKKAPAKRVPVTKAAPAKKAAATRAARAHARQYICNVVPSKGTDKDWQLRDSIAAGSIGAPAPLPASVDMRAPWWKINNQEDTGSCVGWATADGVVRWHMVQAGKLSKRQLLSPRHVWMASKETDTITTRPESFIEGAGTMVKAAVDVARKTGVALMDDLPFHIQTKMYTGNENTFYASCAQRKISAYFNLHKNVASWKTWLADNGPILAAFNVDSSWDNAASNDGKIDTFHPDTVRGGHAICIVGYRADGRFIVRNSWGTTWGDKGFGYLHPDYIAAAFFDESYGVTL
jgi:Papain family cysteine protease